MPFTASESTVVHRPYFQIKKSEDEPSYGVVEVMFVNSCWTVGSRIPGGTRMAQRWLEGLL